MAQLLSEKLPFAVDSSQYYSIEYTIVLNIEYIAYSIEYSRE